MSPLTFGSNPIFSTPRHPPLCICKYHFEECCRWDMDAFSMTRKIQHCRRHAPLFALLSAFRLLVSFPTQGIIGRVNTYYSYNAAIDAAEDTAEAEEQKKALAAAASQGGDVDEPRLHLPPIEQSSSNGSSTGDGQRPKSPPPRPKSASRHIISGRPSRSDGWHLG